VKYGLIWAVYPSAPWQGQPCSALSSLVTLTISICTSLNSGWICTTWHLYDHHPLQPVIVMDHTGTSTRTCRDVLLTTITWPTYPQKHQPAAALFGLDIALCQSVMPLLALAVKDTDAVTIQSYSLSPVRTPRTLCLLAPLTLPVLALATSTQGLWKRRPPPQLPSTLFRNLYWSVIDLNSPRWIGIRCTCSCRGHIPFYIDD
jgi:hypothetical protein